MRKKVVKKLRDKFEKTQGRSPNKREFRRLKKFYARNRDFDETYTSV